MITPSTRRTASFLTAITLASSAFAHADDAAPPEAAVALPKIANFALLDHTGRFHELDYYCRTPGVKGIVLFIQGNGCPLVRKRLPQLKRLQEEYQEQGILFGMLNANPQDDRDEIIAEAKEFEVSTPILIDDSQMVAEMLGVDRTAEVFFIAASDKQLLYRGAIDDRLSYQSEKPEAEKTYLRDALDAFIKGEPIQVTQVEAPGCLISMPEPEKREAISYSADVAPIIANRCVECHTQGGLAPFAMSNYQKLTGWTDMIEEVVLSQQMPPWHADPHIGKFANASGLTPDEKATLIGWIRAGAPRGEGDDPLETATVEPSEWQLGTPDLVIEIPEQTIEAEGIIDYRYVNVDAPNGDEDLWIEAVEIKPGNTRVLHHVVVTAFPKGQKDKSGRNEKWITGYAPGTAPKHFPENTGILLPKGYTLKFQLHYTASGKPETDQTRFGIHTRSTAPEKEFRIDTVIHPMWKIPPHSAEYSQRYVKKIPKNVRLFAMNPHMHYRGKRMSFTAQLPDGTQRPILSVPNYNFNWQRTYVLAEPIDLPAGTEIIIENAWDNSATNLHNPDPNKEVRWGDQSFDEMFFATLSYVLLDD